MYNVLIVDDEPFVVETISLLLTENLPEPPELYHAYSASSALSCMHRRRIDILITDISMPGMSGLELAGVVREFWPACSIMILSAYADFDFAREAMEQKVCSYVLKSDPDEKILAGFQSCVRQYQSFLKNGLSPSSPLPEPNDPQQILRENALWSILDGHCPEERFRTLLPALGFHNSGRYVLALSFFPADQPQNATELPLQSRTQLMKFRDCVHLCALRENTCVWLWQIPADLPAEDFLNCLTGAYELLGLYTREAAGTNMGIIVSNVLEDTAHLPPAYQLLRARAIRARDTLRDVVVCRVDPVSESAGGIVQAVDQYIHQHIFDDVSLSAISMNVGYNPAYLSRIYQQTCGRTISDTITEFKISGIQDLLMHTRLSLGEISEKSGFETQSYFNRFVRRITGLTPGQLRNRLLSISPSDTP